MYAMERGRYRNSCRARSKFWVTDDGKKNPDDQAGLPRFFNEMVDYIAAMNAKGEDPMVQQQATVSK